MRVGTALALELPENPNQRDILKVMVKAYRAGVTNTLNLSAVRLGQALAESRHKQE